MQFDLEAVREIMWQGMTEDKYRNAQEPIEDVSDEQGMTENEYRNAQEPIEGVFDEAGRSCVRLWAALASKFGKKKRGGQAAKRINCTATSNISFIEPVINFFLLNKCISWGDNKMDRRQTCNIVDTPPKDRCYWPAVEGFPEREEISNGAISSRAYTRCMKSKIADAINTDHRSC